RAISGSCSRDNMKTGLAGKLHGVSTNVARSAMDEHSLPGGDLRMFEKHLPSRKRYNWGRGRFDEGQILRFWRDDCGRGEREFCVRPAKVLVGCSVHLVTNLES